jgi:RNA polymerase sigma-70 factor (ECF subfamily)
MRTQADKDIFVQLMDDHKGIIIKICNTYCQDKNDREDLAQEILYQLWRAMDKYDKDQRFSTWMYRVALNVAISFYRKNKIKNHLISFSGQTAEIADQQDEKKELETHIGQLQQFISELKELDRALMFLYLESKTYREIAEILGISETNVASRINCIKEKLKLRFTALKK